MRLPAGHGKSWRFASSEQPWAYFAWRTANGDALAYWATRTGHVNVTNLGSIYVAGWGSDTFAIPHWLVRKSTDSGNTWATADDYQTAASTATFANAVIADSANNIYVAGEVVRKFTYNTSTWANVPALSELSGLIFGGAINGMAIDAQSNIYLVGGTAWTTVMYNSISSTVTAIDQVGWGSNNSSNGVTVDSTGHPYVTGTGSSGWLTRILSP